VLCACSFNYNYRIWYGLYLYLYNIYYYYLLTSLWQAKRSLIFFFCCNMEINIINVFTCVCVCVGDGWVGEYHQSESSEAESKPHVPVRPSDRPTALSLSQIFHLNYFPRLRFQVINTLFFFFFFFKEIFNLMIHWFRSSDRSMTGTG
jgi:hypothetical protein